MFKKLVGFLIITFVLYILVIFNMPVIGEKIGETLGIQSFNETIISFKSYIDDASTDTPTPDDLKDSYNSTLSGVLEFKNDILNGITDVKEGVDTVRSTLSGAVDTYNDVKETITDTKETIDSTVDTIKETTESIKDTAEAINGISDDFTNTLSGTLSN